MLRYVFNHGGESGKAVLRFFNLDDFDDIQSKLNKGRDILTSVMKYISNFDTILTPQQKIAQLQEQIEELKKEDRPIELELHSEILRELTEQHIRN